ncbi:diguanylate cyclase [Pseudomonas daroniae]|uniref:diguanylate cyclase n=1 Tax=Phytopseudomonas daroniae TaxID=2487519 RepID=A0A4Q9QIJ2_9GAMM|nr:MULTISPECIES: diguanylate cyclase [Pseudomonas]TBU73622.1 diguanylate cyclase [Pseudomonas daroniae]TBU73896.1 diguanylate cyclase [Pseudomonas daroniae]TBU74905.1 diguanylate cyclase [Pseudomonas sp. FRB 228]TBU88766.1 diguanylate cyclase [Pseudomonas daroniae]
MGANMDLNEFHWLLAIVQSIDVGVVVLDRDYRVEVWNSFMVNHSGRTAREASERSFFELFPEVEESWFRRKVESVATLGTPAFTIWEQRPYLVRFKNYQPITGLEDFMYQNTTILPLQATNSRIEHLCLIIYDVTSVAVNKRQLQSMNDQFKHLSRTDRLTGLNNRGHWEEELKREHARHRRYGSSASLVIFDIDHFKKVNDTYGHQAGDSVIQSLAKVVREQIRDTDIAGRYGGEEFVVLLPDVDAAGGRIFAERLRGVVERLQISHEGQVIPFTISLGVADLSRPSHDHQQLIEWADQALYSSKRNGRNQVTVFGA